MTRFLLIRHATNDTVGKVIAGRMPGVHLNTEGEAQAQKLAERLTKMPIQAIYCSPMDRAKETANTIAAPHKLDPVIIEELNEFDCGQWSGHTIEQLKTEPLFRLFNSFRSGTRIPGGETMAEVQVRMIRAIEKLNSNRDETIVLVSHGDPIKATVAYYAGIPLDMIHRLEISPASVSILELYPETARITLMNGFTAEL